MVIELVEAQVHVGEPLSNFDCEGHFPSKNGMQKQAEVSERNIAFQLLKRELRQLLQG